MNKKAAIALGIGIGVVAAVGITAAVMYNKKMKEQEEDIELLFADGEDSETDTVVCFSHAISTQLTFDEAQDIAILAAREQFGDDAFVVPASEKKALYVNIADKKRACFMFGAGELNLTDGTMTGLYHVDADTGEVFDNSKGTMEKIR